MATSTVASTLNALTYSKKGYWLSEAYSVMFQMEQRFSLCVQTLIARQRTGRIWYSRIFHWNGSISGHALTGANGHSTCLRNTASASAKLLESTAKPIAISEPTVLSTVSVAALRIACNLNRAEANWLSSIVYAMLVFGGCEIEERVLTGIVENTVTRRV